MSVPKNSQELSQETKDLISSLPVQKNVTLHCIHKYEGFWYAEWQLVGVISSRKHFQARDSDVLIATAPKCGTMWMKAITFAILNRKECPVLSKDHPLLTRNPHDLAPFIELDLYRGGRVPDMQPFSSSSSSSPRLFATHMPFVSLPDSIKGGSSSCKIVYVSRNPKDTLVSLWHFLAKLGFLNPATSSIEDMFECFCKGMNSFGPFWDHVLEYWKQSVENPERVLFVKYEDLKEEPRLQLRRVAEFLNCPFTPEEEESGMVDRILELTSFGNLSSLEFNKTGKSIAWVENSVTFRKGEVGDWVNYLSAEMGDKIDEITRLKFAGSGLEL